MTAVAIGYGVHVAGANDLTIGVATPDRAIAMVNMINREYAGSPATLVLGVLVNPNQDTVRDALDVIARSDPTLGLRRITARKEKM